MQTPTGDLWRARMRMPSGEYGDRAASDDTERAFWHTFMPGRTGHTTDPYAAPVAKVLCGLVERESDARSILEIGPGWGNYTLALAARCKTMTCVDISPDVLGYIERIAHSAGFGHVNTLCNTWEAATPARHDLVFAYNCFYRMRNIESCLAKINDTAHKLCIIGMNRSPEQPYLPILEHELGLPMRYTRSDYHELWHILGEMGIAAEMLEIPNARDYHYTSFEELFDRAVQYIEGPYNPDAVKEVLLRYYHPSQRGYTCRYLFSSGLLVWRPADR